MKANELPVIRFLGQSDTQFIIPVYQRNYDWTVAQCRQLLDDILSVGNNNDLNSHFIGSIVYIHDDVYSTSGIRELSIIDGQQRLTTITLIYLAIANLCKELGNEQQLSRIQETYLINKFAKDEEKLKLRPTENNDKSLRFLLRSDAFEEYLEYSRLIENYKFFKGRILSDNIEIVLKGLNKLIFVEISLERGKDDPQRIFESLNSTGLDLSQADLIRNFVLMGLKHKEQEKVYLNFWKYIENFAVDENTNTNKVSDFIRDFLTLRNKEIPNKNKVYLEFKKNYPIRDLETLEKILSQLKKYVGYYNKFLNPKNEPDIEIRGQLKNINRLEINVAYPFLLEVYNDYANNIIDKSAFIEVLELIQSFSWRRFIVGLPTNALNKIFMRLYEDIDSTNYIISLQKSLIRKKASQRFPNDYEVTSILKEKDMYGIQPKNRNYFFERLENFENREFVPIEENTNITIEHIFPQNPEPKWKVILGEIEFKTIKDKYVNTIANLTLSGNNGKLSNKYFTEKRDLDIDNQEQGYKFSRLWLNKHLSTLEKWDLEELDKRYDLIAERFKKIWKYPSAIEVVESNEEINIFDAEDPTDKKLAYVIFFDQKLEIKTVSELYAEVMKSLFDLQPQSFLNESISSKISLSQNQNDLRQPLKISESYFIESNLASKHKFERLKLVLNSIGLTDDLYIKYS